MVELNILEGNKVEMVFDPVKSPFVLTVLDVQTEAEKKGISSAGMMRAKHILTALTEMLTDKHSKIRDEISKHLRDPDAANILYLMVDEVKALAEAEKDAIYAA